MGFFIHIWNAEQFFNQLSRDRCLLYCHTEKYRRKGCCPDAVCFPDCFYESGGNVQVLPAVGAGKQGPCKSNYHNYFLRYTGRFNLIWPNEIVHSSGRNDSVIKIR